MATKPADTQITPTVASTRHAVANADTDVTTTAPLRHPPMWTVTLIFVNPNGELPVVTNHAKREILSSLAGKTPILGVGEDYLTITLDIPALDHRSAASVANATCDDAFVDAGLPVMPVTECQVIHSRRLAAKTQRMPDLIGVSEIAEILGTSKQRAWQHSKTNAFPASACHPKAGPLWRRIDIVRFAKRRTE